MSNDREQILKMIEAGQISVAEALELLDAIEDSDQPEETWVAEDSRTAGADPPTPHSWWVLLATVGAVVMAIGAPLVALGLSGRAALIWALCCGWVPLLIGLGIFTLGVWSRSARWLHLRIRNRKSGRRTFALSLPLPLTLSAWILRLIRPYVPQLNETGVDEAILALRDGMNEKDDQPLYIDVQNEDDEEQVLIYIG